MPCLPPTWSSWRRLGSQNVRSGSEDVLRCFDHFWPVLFQPNDCQRYCTEIPKGLDGGCSWLCVLWACSWIETIIGWVHTHNTVRQYVRGFQRARRHVQLKTLKNATRRNFKRFAFNMFQSLRPGLLAQPPNVAQVNKTFAQHEARCPWLVCLGEQWVGCTFDTCVRVCVRVTWSLQLVPNFLPTSWATASETGQFERCLHYIASRLMLLLSVFRKQKYNMQLQTFMIRCMMLACLCIDHFYSFRSLRSVFLLYSNFLS